jgi:molybdopterin synthase sulfur carrier subunit
MKIWVRGYLGLETALGDRPFVELAAERVTVRDLLAQLGHRADETGPRAAAGLGMLDTDVRLAILVNGRHTSHLPDGLDTVLADGDRVSIFPPVAGG